MEYFMELTDCVRKVRANNNISHRRPITKLTIISNDDIINQCLMFENYIKDELNILNISSDTNIDNYYSQIVRTI